MLAEVQAEVERRPADTAFVLLLDFDGTLAEFNPDPAAPELTPERYDLLMRIAVHPAVSLGIVSGRRLDDLRRRTRLPDHVYHAGLHGLEIEIDGTRTTHPDLPCAIERARGAGRMPCASCSMSFPTPSSRTRAPAWPCMRGGCPKTCTHACSRAPTCCAVPWIAKNYVRRLEGNAVVEYLPNIDGHKGDATRWIVADVETKLQRAAWVAYIGDDITDEDAFRAITDRASACWSACGQPQPHTSSTVSPMSIVS